MQYSLSFLYPQCEIYVVVTPACAGKRKICLKINYFDPWFVNKIKLNITHFHHTPFYKPILFHSCISGDIQVILPPYFRQGTAPAFLLAKANPAIVLYMPCIFSPTLLLFFFHAFSSKVLFFPSNP